MSDSRWQRVEEIFHRAVELAPETRSAFLDDMCAGDESLRKEVESLLAHDAEDGSTLANAVAGAAGGTVTVVEDLSGRTIGQYKVLGRLGEGGMGVVYKASDTRLGRSVALKFVKAHFSRRWEREARAVAALNHPHIATLYEVGEHEGVPYLAMELVQGSPLKGPLPIEDALACGIQIADALAAAHAAGIVHRDLKPGNILVTKAGVKLLDFGVAQMTPAQGPDAGAIATQTLTSSGVIVGTPQYMAPEQIEGKAVDARADIFAFGAVFYEMLTGGRAFEGESQASVMAAILEREPPDLPDTVAPALRQIVAGCLEKDPAARFESARDLAFALRAISAGSGLSTAFPRAGSSARARGGRWLLPALAAAVVALAALSAFLYGTRPEPLDLSAYKFTPVATDAEVEESGSWSPDGKSIAYLKMIDFRRQVMVRNLNTPSPMQLTRLPSGMYQSAPFFAPDGERVYFIASGALWSVAAVGGEPREVLRAPMVGAALSPDGKTLAFWQRYEEAGKQYSGVWISSPPGAPPRKYEPAPFRVESLYAPDYLRFSPDGSQIGLAAYRRGAEAWLWILPWPDGPKVRPRQPFSSHSFSYVPAFDWMPDSRHICLSADGGLWLGDSGTGKLQRLTAWAGGDAYQPSVSPGGERVLFTARDSDYDIIELPLDGSAPRPVLATARNESSPSSSATGDLMAFITDRSGESEIWLRSPSGDWERPAVRQSDFPDDPRRPFEGVSLSPDGTRLAYYRAGRLWVSPVSGGHASQAVVGSEGETAAPSWSPDSSSITYIGNSGGKLLVAVARIGSQQPQLLIPGTANQCASAPVWSPDGLWIACGGFDRTVLLVSPDGNERRALRSPVPAASHGFVLVWSRNAETIYVASSTSPKARLDAIDVRLGSSRRIAEYPGELRFTTPYNYFPSGSLSRDGKSFATTVLSEKSDLWILEGFPRPRRRWF
jgi:Tol biopolymer transport system component